MKKLKGIQVPCYLSNYIYIYTSLLNNIPNRCLRCQYPEQVIEDVAKKSKKSVIKIFLTFSPLFCNVGEQQEDTGKLINASV